MGPFGDKMHTKSRVAIRAIVGAGLSWLLLFGAVQAGMGVPSYELISGIAEETLLDYSALPHSLAPLSSEYIARALGLDPGVAIGSSPGSGAVVAAADDSGSPPAQPATGGTGIDPSRGERRVVEHEATNDDFADAYPISSVRFTARTDSSGASRESGDPSDCGLTGGTLWYRFEVAGAVGLVASTSGDRPASLAIYSGTDLASLERVGCDTDPLTGRTSVAFPAETDTSYYVQITGPGGGGPIVFSLDPLGVTEQVSVPLDEGEIRNGLSIAPALSADGRFVTFMSFAQNLVDGDNNGKSDVFVYDRVTDRTELVSVSSEEQQGDGPSGDLQSTMSADGRYVAFFSDATNLVPGDRNGFSDVFVRDRVRGTTTRVSVTSSGQERDCLPVCDPFTPAVETYPEGSHVRGVSITPDGRFIAFEYVAGLDERYPPEPPAQRAQDGLWGVYVHDRKMHTTELVSVNDRGEPATGAPGSFPDFPVISADGRYVAFRSDATNLVCGEGSCDRDTNASFDVFVHDRKAHETERVSVDSEGNQQDYDSFLPAMSADGRYVAFSSWSDLAPSELGQADGDVDVFVHDRKTGDTELVSVNSAGEPQDQGGANGHDGGTNDQLQPAISADGRYVAFSSMATNLADDNNNGVRDIFLHDRRTGITTLLSVSSAGIPGEASSALPALSADGRFVAFSSETEFVAEDDETPDQDVFVHSLPFL